MTDHGRTNPQGTAEQPVRWLMWLERLPKVAVFLAVLVVVLGLLFTPGPAGGVLVLLLAAGAGFFLWTQWRRFTPSARFVRIIPVAVLTALGVVKFFL